MKSRLRIRPFPFLFFMAYFTSGCTIVHYSLNRELTAHAASARKANCAISYVLDVRNVGYTNTFGETEFKVPANIVNTYVQATEQVLAARGCTVTKADEHHPPNLRITIADTPFLSALPQEWLTGLSFGLIPSWGKRPAQFQYFFEDLKLNEKDRYAVDDWRFNHIIVFPFVWLWIRPVGPSEIDLYKVALDDFVMSQE